jgi:RND family efflux transporter MFP subunit
MSRDPRLMTRRDAGFPARALCLALFLVLALGLPSAGCRGGGDGAAADSTAAAGADSSAAAGAAEAAEEEPAKEKAIKVNVGEVRRGDLVLPVYADGTIRTPRSAAVKTKVGGQLLEVKVRDGDRVRRNQVLARIDPREYELAREESRYRHLAALSQMAAEGDTFTTNAAAVADFVAERDRLAAAHDRGELARDAYQAQLLALEKRALQDGAFREAVFQQRTGLAEARLAEERARLNLEYTEIRAPFDGVVQGVSMVIGEIVGTGALFCTVTNNDRLEAAVNVLEADLGDLAAGRPVLLAVAATGDTLRARVDVISPTLDQASRTCEVLIRFANPDGRLRPGMFVRAQIAGVVFRDRLLVPKDAVLVRDNRPLVFKREDDRARWLYVDIGLQNDQWVEILAVHSGGSLEAAEEVVVSDHLTLAHEAKISVRKRVPPDDRWDFAAGTLPDGSADAR